MPVSPKKTKKNILKNGYGIYLLSFVMCAIVFGAGFFAVHKTLAATGINKQINFQGKVVNTNGTNVTNGDYDFVFKIYSVDSGGTAIWTETRTGGNQVTVTDGIFQVNLGSVTALPGSVDFNTDNIYLGIEFNSDGEMSPRVRFTAAPYAMNADKVHGLTVTDTTGTLTIPNGETISFGGSFTTSASNDVTLTTSAATNVTLPTTGTLATLAGTEEFTNKTIGSTGLTFSGATTDITTGINESLIIVANGSGVVDIQDATTVDSLTTDTGGISIASSQSYTGSGAITLSSGGAGALTIDSASGTITTQTDDDIIPTLGAGDADLGSSGTRWDNIYGTAGNFTSLTVNGTSDPYVDESGDTMTGALALDPATTGTFLDFILETQWTAGDLINADWGSATTQTAALTGLNLDFTNLTSVAGSTTYGLLINDLAAQTSSTEYALYQEGTNWDYGIYAEDAAHFNTTVNIVSTLDARGDISDSTGNLTLNDAVDISGALAVSGTSLTATSATTITLGSTGADTIILGNGGADTITIGNVASTGVSITDNNWSISTAGVASFITGSTIGSQTFTTNNIADSGALTVSSGAASALTLDSGTTGTVNLGTGNNAKTINIATGTAGNAINIGTNNTTSDTIVIGSALDNVAITGDQWSITDAGVLTVVSCSGCGGSQTPWTSDINAAGYDLGSLSNLGFQETTGAPTGTDVGFYRDNTGDLTGNVLTGKTFNLAVNGTDEYNFSSSALAMNSNNITGLGTNLTAAGTLTITSTTTGLTLDSGSGTITTQTDDDIIPTLGAGDADLGSSGTRWDNIYGTAGNFTSLTVNGTSDPYVDESGDTMTGALTLDPTTTGTFLDFILETQWTAGDLINVDWGSATTQTAALTGLNLDFTNLTSVAGSTTYGLLINDLAAQTSSTEYALYQEGTNWDYGIYVEDAAHFNTTVNIVSTLDARGDISDSTGNLTLNDAVDISGALAVSGTTSSTASTTYIQSGSTLTFNPGSASSTIAVANYGQVTYTGTGGFSGGAHMLGSLGWARMNSSGQTASLIIGTEGKVENIDGSTTTAVGLEGQLSTNTVGLTVDTFIGADLQVSGNAGTLNNYYGAYVQGGGNTGTIGNYYGFGLAMPTGTVTNATGIYVPNLTASSINLGISSNVASGASKYNLYVAGTAQNYFAGNVGIGDSTPDSPLEITSTTSPQFRLSYTDGSVDGTIGLDSNEYLLLQAGTNAEIRRVQIGDGGAGSTTPDFFGLDVKSDTGDPAGGFEGAMYYNTSDNKFRCYQNTGWTDCISAGGSQTPWTSDINAAGYDLGSLSNLGFQETTGAPTGTDVGFYRDNTGDLTGNVLTGKTFNLAVNGTDEYNFSSSALAMNSNNITGLGTNLTAAAGLTIATGTASALTLDSGTTGTISIGSDGSAETINVGTGVAVKTIVIGNSTDDSFTLNSSGLNVTSGGVLTGVASIDTISVSSTALTFAGAGTLASGGSSGLTIDSASGVVSVATGDYLALSHSGVSGAAAGYIWYDSSDNKFKINENGTTKTLCNTTDAGCGGGSSDLQTTYGNDADGSNVTISLTAADDGLIVTNPTSGGNDLSSFTMQISQQNTTAAIKVLDIVQSSNAANAVDITANSIDTETGLSITANGLTSGKGITIASSSATFTGDLAGITLSGSSVSNTGNVFSVANTGTANANVSLFVDHRATGTNNLAVRINDESGDTTPFVIDGTGKVGIGTTAPSRAMDIVESASAPQLRLSKDLTYYSEMTVDSVGDLQISATGTDIRALSENIWVCDNDACPALTLTGDGNIFVENVLKFGNGVYMKNDSATELSVYDNDDNAMLIFDEQ